MAEFTKKYGIVQKKAIQIKSINKKLRNRILNYIEEEDKYDYFDFGNTKGKISKYLLAKLGYKLNDSSFNI